MNETEYLLVCLAEECAEVQQAVGKALRFGLDDSPPSGGTCNRGKIMVEVQDVLAIVEMLRDRRIVPTPLPERLQEMLDNKKEKVLRFMNYSRERGTLSLNEPAATAGTLGSVKQAGSTPAPVAAGPTPETDALVGRKCAATMPSDPPQDCNAPYCDCDPVMALTIQDLRNDGWKTPDEVKQIEREATLAKLKEFQQVFTIVQTAAEHKVVAAFCEAVVEAIAKDIEKLTEPPAPETGPEYFARLKAFRQAFIDEQNASKSK